MSRNPGSRVISPRPSVHLKRFAEVGSLAFVGASNDNTKWGYRILHNILDGGFTGRVYPVNPKDEEVHGLKAYPSLASLPEVADVALVCVPAPVAARAVEEAARAGVRAVVVITAGFAEAGNSQAEEELARVAREWGLAMVGPNSMGFFSARTQMHAIMSSSRPQHGGVSFVSQSGNVGSQGIGRGHLHGAGFSLMFSSGNAAALDWADYLEFLADDPETRVIALYLEGVRDGHRFLESMQKAVLRKPVLITKGGKTGAGSRAAKSHTAALATSDGLFSGLVRQAGGVLLRSIEEMMDLAAAMDVAPVPAGPRVAIVTWGGGWGVLATDACIAAGLEVPPLSEATRAALDRLLPPYWSRDNPVDLVGGVDHEAHLEALAVLARDPGFDALLVLGMLSSPDPYLGDRADFGLAGDRSWGIQTAEVMTRLVEETGKTMVGVSLGGVAPPPEALGRLPVYHTPNRAVGVLAGLVQYSRVLGRKARTPRRVNVDRKAAGALLRSVPGGCSLSERESLQLLACYGVTTVAWELIQTEREAAAAAERLGYPVVLKASGRGIAHKTERGLVVVGIRGKTELAREWRSVHSRLRTGDEVEGFLVQPALTPGREFAMGLVRDPIFGPCVMFGQGGVYAEAVSDVSFRSAGLRAADAEEMITEVRASALLGPVRGQPAVDRKALADILVRLGQLGRDFPEIAEVDVNPILLPDGKPVAADALVVVARL